MEITSKMFQIHPSSIVNVDKVEIGDKTKIWHFVHIRDGAKIGDNCSIGDHCYIDEQVKIGNNVKIANGVSIYKGVTIEDDVFIGPNATFLNVRKPRSYEPVALSAYETTIVRHGATIGANSTILCGVDIGENSMVGAGAVVNSNVQINDTVLGNPAHSMRKYNKFKITSYEQGTTKN